MSKSPDAFRTISEVATWLDVPTHVLRFWESRFTHVKPVKRAGGRRYYRPADMRLLGGIKQLLHDDGLTIRGVQKLLREQGVRHVSSLSRPLDTMASGGSGRDDDADDASVAVRADDPARDAGFRTESSAVDDAGTWGDMRSSSGPPAAASPPPPEAPSRPDDPDADGAHDAVPDPAALLAERGPPPTIPEDGEIAMERADGNGDAGGGLGFLCARDGAFLAARADALRPILARARALARSMDRPHA